VRVSVGVRLGGTVRDGVNVAVSVRVAVAGGVNVGVRVAVPVRDGVSVMVAVGWGGGSVGVDVTVGTALGVVREKGDRRHELSALPSALITFAQLITPG